MAVRTRLRLSVLFLFLVVSALVAWLGDLNSGLFLAGASLIFYPVNTALQMIPMPPSVGAPFTAVVSLGLFIPALVAGISAHSWIAIVAAVVLLLGCSGMKDISIDSGKR